MKETAVKSRSVEGDVAANRTDDSDPGPSLAGLENSVAFALRLAYAAAVESFARLAEETGLRAGQYAILQLIAANPGISQTALSKASGRDKSTLTPILANLSRRGLIEKVKDENDRRSLKLTLSAKGEERLKVLAAHASANEAFFDSIIGLENKPALLEMLNKIAARLTDKGSAPPHEHEA